MPEFYLQIFADPILRGAIGFALGAVTGSFLNVCASRIPNGVSIIRPASRCPNCNDGIAWKNNIPIVSWLFLKGKSKCCDYRIPLRYFVLEFLTAVLFAFFFVSFGNIYDYHYLLTSLIFIPIITVVIVIDLETMTIPDRFSIGGAIVGLILSFLMPALHGFSNEPLFLERVSALLASLLGMLISSSILYWIGAIAERLMRREALGQGDVKLLGFVGAFCGWQGGLFVIFGGAIVGTVLLIPVMIISKFASRKYDSDHGNGIGLGMEVPFGPFLGIASIFYFLGLREFVEDWFETSFADFNVFFSGL